MLVQELTGDAVVGLRIELDNYQMQMLADFANALNFKAEKVVERVPSKKGNVDKYGTRGVKLNALNKMINREPEKVIAFLKTIEDVQLFLTKISKNAPSRDEVLDSLTNPNTHKHKETVKH